MHSEGGMTRHAADPLNLVQKQGWRSGETFSPIKLFEHWKILPGHLKYAASVKAVLRSRSRWSRNYLGPGAGAEIKFLINILLQSVRRMLL